jgi:hypothetical protein
MNNSGMSFLMQQLPYQLPILIVCLGGFALAAIFLNKHFSAAALTMVGTGLLIFATLVVMVGQFALIQQGGFNTGNWMRVLGVGGSLMRAVATALILAAVFIGRADPQPFKTPPYQPQR